MNWCCHLSIDVYGEEKEKSNMQMLKNSYAHKIGAKMNNLTLNGVRVKEQKKIHKRNLLLL